MRTDAFLLGHQRQGAEHQGGDNKGGFDVIHNFIVDLVVWFRRFTPIEGNRRPFYAGLNPSMMVFAMRRKRPVQIH
jgi:hypothetical protein